MPQKGPRIINLDDNSGKGKNKEYIPPTSLTVHLSKIDIPELRPRGTPFDRQPTTRHDQDSGKKKDKDSKRVKEKERTKDGGKYKDSDGRVKRPSLPATYSMPPLHSTAIHKYRSQYFHPTSSTLSPSYHAPPLPPRTQAPQHSSGTFRRRSLNADQYYYDDVQHEGTSSSAPLTSGLLGRFLGR